MRASTSRLVFNPSTSNAQAPELWAANQYAQGVIQYTSPTFLPMHVSATSSLAIVPFFSLGAKIRS